MSDEKFVPNQINKRGIRRKYSQLSLQIALFLVLIGSISIQAASEIHLVMDGGSISDWRAVVRYEFYYHPNEVFVNGVKHDICRQTCDLTPGRNDVIIKFNDQLTSCNQMFQYITEILEVDLSYFDASQVLDMGHMFQGCSNLAKVTFGDNIDTSKVTNMGQFFEHCHTLTSIDLSKLNTAQVTSMESAFNSCYSLKTLDLSHLNTARVKNMMWMFYDCYNLE